MLLRRSGMDHTVLPAITPVLPLPRKRSPDGASPDWGCAYLIAAYYSFVYPKGWKAESAWLADLQRTVYPHKWSPISCRSSAGQGKFAGQRPTFYQLCHATNQATSYCTSLRRSNKLCWSIQRQLGNIINGWENDWHGLDHGQYTRWSPYVEVCSTMMSHEAVCFFHMNSTQLENSLFLPKLARH